MSDKPRFSLSEAMDIRNRVRDGMVRQLPTWRLLAQYISPERLKENPDDKNNGTRKGSKILKNTASLSLRTFVSGMMNGATPRSRPWFNLTVNNKGKATTNAAKKYFSEAESVINSHFQVSNLYRILPMAYKDVGVFSNSAFAMLPDARYGFYFYPFAIGTYGFSCDAQGNTDTFYRDFSMSVRQIVHTYAKLKDGAVIDWTGIPEWVRTNWDNAKYQETAILTTLILPNRHYNPDNRNPLDPADRRFQSYTWLHSAGGNLPPQTSSGFRNEQNVASDNGGFIKVSGYDYFPVITPRWETMPEEDYGIDGPGHTALSDIMGLQEMERWRLEAIAKLVKPPMVGHASLRRHQASILAGGITYVDDQGAQAGFKPAFQIDPKLVDLLQSQAEYAQHIRSSYYEDLFLMLSSSETKTHVTAREIDEKAAERMSALAPVLGQWDQDLSSKLIYNAQMILSEAQRMPEVPRELRDENIRPEYISVLAQAAKASMMNSLERAMSFATSVASAHQDPALLKIIDPEKAVRMYADYVAIDPTMVTDEASLAEMRRALQAKQMQEQAMAAQAAQAETLQKLSQAEVGKGSMLDASLAASQA